MNTRGLFKLVVGYLEVGDEDPDVAFPQKIPYILPTSCFPQTHIRGRTVLVCRFASGPQAGFLRLQPIHRYIRSNCNNSSGVYDTEDRESIVRTTR
jgi:hypothetical protein